MKCFIVIWFSFILIFSFGQKDVLEDSLKFWPDSSVIYKWPYFVNHHPPYVGLIGGYEGFNSNYWEVGLVFNIGHGYSSAKTGAISGMAMSYKQHFTQKTKAIEAEFGIYYLLSFGINFNFHFNSVDQTLGFKPFIGTSFYHFQFLWGYNFFSKSNAIDNLTHSTFKLRYSIPLLRLDK